MKHELWYRIYEISGISAVVFSIITLFFIIRFRFFSLLRFSIQNRKQKIKQTEVKDHNDISVKTEQLIKIQPQVSKGTVIAEQPVIKTGTVIAADNFMIRKNIIITGTDPSFIDSVISSHHR